MTKDYRVVFVRLFVGFRTGTFSPCLPAQEWQIVTMT